MDLKEAVVLAVHPATHSVDLIIDDPNDPDEILEANVPLLSQSLDPLLRGGTVALPKVGTNVIVASVRNQMFVLGCIPEYTERPDPDQSVAQTISATVAASISSQHHDTFGNEFGGLDTVYKRMGGPNWRGGRPLDAMPGDWVHYGTDGNLVAVLEGGVSILKGSDTAQIQAHKATDTVRIVARRFELLTDFGELKFTSDQGRAGFSIRGSNDLNRAVPGAENFNLNFILGDNGIPFVRIGNEQCFLELRNGNIYHKGELIKVKDPTVPGPVVKFTEADAETKKIAGPKVTDIEGRREETVGGDKVSAVKGSKETQVDGDFSINSRSMQTAVQGTYDLAAAGWTNPVQDGPPVPFVNEALSLRAINGNMLIQTGDTLVSGVAPGPQSNIFRPSTLIETYNGDIKLRCTGLGGAIELSAPVPPSATMTGGPTYGIVLNSPQVLIGGMPGATHMKHPAPGPYPPSPMAIAKALPIIEWMKAITTLLQNHIHPCTSGAIAPSVELAAGLPAITTAAAIATPSAVAFVPPL